LLISSGNQKCKGGAPAFINKEINTRVSVTSKVKTCEVLALRVVPAINIVDARAWTRKYLRQASVRFLLILLSMMGAMLIRLISSPIQLVNHELALIAISEPRIKVVINKYRYDLINIKKKEI
jgi:hypothetical protein